MAEHINRYPPLIAALARQAVDIAVDAPPHRPQQGTVVFSLARLIPVAAAQLAAASSPPPPPPPAQKGAFGDHAEAADVALPTDPSVRFVDGYGQRRPVYRPVAFHVLAQRFRAPEPSKSDDAEPDIAVTLWQAVAMRQDADLDEIDRLLQASDGPLHIQGYDDNLDHWTYRELAGLHALDHLAQRHARPFWQRRVREIAAYHVQHTQPDYTTYQPWGLAAFLRDSATASFAEQQLHDVSTHLHIEGGRGAVLPGLLLTDAFLALQVPG